MEFFGKLIYSPERASGEAVTKVKSHTPKIEAPQLVKAGQPFELKISVGPHPSTVQHSIRKIEVYYYEKGRSFNPVLLATIRLTPAYTEPEVKLVLRLKKSGTIYAIGYCNLHGLWEDRKEIRVEE